MLLRRVLFGIAMLCAWLVYAFLFVVPGRISDGRLYIIMPSAIAFVGLDIFSARAYWRYSYPNEHSFRLRHIGNNGPLIFLLLAFIFIVPRVVLSTWRNHPGGGGKRTVDYCARYYGSSLGRFTSPDPEQASASLFNPQLWNSYSYAINNPLAYKDPDGRNPLLVTAAVGAGVGALVGGGFEFYSRWSKNGYSLDDIKWGKVGTAALGGGVAGGVAGLTLGFGTAAGITLGTAETVGINAGANIIGGEVQRQANDAFGLEAAPTGADEAAAVAIDGVTGGVGGLVGGRISDEIYPLPNVRKEIQQLQFASRRSTRAAQIQSFSNAVDGKRLSMPVSQAFKGVPEHQFGRGGHNCFGTPPVKLPNQRKNRRPACRSVILPQDRSLVDAVTDEELRRGAAWANCGNDPN